MGSQRGAVPAPQHNPCPGQGWSQLTQPHFAGVGEVVVAGHVAPLAPIVPHDDHAVLPREKIAVGLPRVPVLVKLGGQAGQGAWGTPAHTLSWRGGAAPAHTHLQPPGCDTPIGNEVPSPCPLAWLWDPKSWGLAHPRHPRGCSAWPRQVALGGGGASTPGPRVGPIPQAHSQAMEKDDEVPGVGGGVFSRGGTQGLAA